MSQCKWDIAWVGQCPNEATEDTDYCKGHTRLCYCGEIATHECGETFALVCGEPLCDDCKCSHI